MSESSKDTQQVSVSLLNTMHTHRQRKIISSMGAREIVWVLYNQVNIFFTEFNTTLCCTEENSKATAKVLYIITKHTQTYIKQLQKT